MNIHICLFSCCIITSGAKRSIICDVQRNDVKFIPNDLFFLIPYFREKTVEELLGFYGDSNKHLVEEYFDFLIGHEFAFYCNQQEVINFPLLNINDFQLPYTISNAIVEIDNLNYNQVKKIIKQLEEVQCYAIEVRIKNKFSIHELSELLELLNYTVIREIDIVAPDNNFSIEEIDELFLKTTPLKKIILHKSTKNIFVNNVKGVSAEIYFTSNDLYHPACCGNFSPNFFTTNLNFITEAQGHNTCLNRKVAIDVNGNIRNCPAMPEVHGNISNTTISDVVNLDAFVSKSKINKDQVKICKDCEFRYICLDCRAYLNDPNDIYSKPLKCGYNPYTCVWEDWSANPIKKSIMSAYLDKTKNHEN